MPLAITAPKKEGSVLEPWVFAWLQSTRLPVDARSRPLLAKATPTWTHVDIEQTEQIISHDFTIESMDLLVSAIQLVSDSISWLSDAQMLHNLRSCFQS